MNVSLKSICGASLLIVFMSGCSNSSKEIPALYVSPLQYSQYDCDQVRTEMARIGTRVSQMTGKLDKNAETDNVVTGVGVVLFWPALFFLGGTKEEEAEYSRLKGEYQALEQVGVEKKCNFQKTEPDKASGDTKSPNTKAEDKPKGA